MGGGVPLTSAQGSCIRRPWGAASMHFPISVSWRSIGTMTEKVGLGVTALRGGEGVMCCMAWWALPATLSLGRSVRETKRH